MTQGEAELYMKIGCEIVYNGIVYARINKILLIWDVYEKKNALVAGASGP